MNTTFNIAQDRRYLLYRKNQEMQDKKNYLLTEAKTTFEKFEVNNNLLKKLKKSKYSNDKKLLKLIFSAGNLKEINKKDKQSIPIRLDFVEKRDIDRSIFTASTDLFN